MNSPRTTLYRDKHNAKLMGVCAGIADYTGVDVFWVRMIAFFSMFLVPAWEFFAAIPTASGNSLLKRSRDCAVCKLRSSAITASS